MRLTEYLEGLKQDFRYAARGFVRRPGFTAVAVVTLAIGIGGTTAIFSAVNALLLRPLPFAAPEQLMSVSLTTPAFGGLRARDDMVWSYAKHRVFRDAQTIFSDLSLYKPHDFNASSGQVELLKGEFVGARYLKTLGLTPLQGSDFDPSIDAHAGAERQVVISYALWERRYNAASSVVGKTLDLDGNPYTVIGVGPAGFGGLTGQVAVFVPITTLPPQDLGENMAQSHEFYMVARRKSNIGVGAAIAAVKILGKRVNETYRDREMQHCPWGATARPLSAVRVSPLVRQTLLVAISAVGLLLLIACVNVANLLLGRASTRRREIAVRRAVGAGAGRIVRLLLAESLLLGALGGLAGTVIAWFGSRVLSRIDPAILAPSRDIANAIGAMTFSAVHLDGATLAFSVSITIIVSLAFGLVPALQALQVSVGDAMKSAGSDGGVRASDRDGRRMLVVAEVALAVILLAGSGLLARSLGKLIAVDPGFDARNVLTLQLAIPSPDYDEDVPSAVQTQLLMQDRFRALPGVMDVALGSCPPLGGGCYRTPIEFPDRAYSGLKQPTGINVNWTTPGWFATLHIPLKRGRLFGSADRAGAPTVVLINETAARAYWPNEVPLRKRVTIGMTTTAEVIGVVGDVRQLVDSLPKPEVYIPYAQYAKSKMTMFVRTVGDPAAVTASVRRVAREVAPQYPVYDVRPMTARIAAATARARFSAVVLGLFAATALSLAVVGIYGVMSLAVTARTREIGVRMALGADPREVRRQVIDEGLRLVSAGAMVGLVGALASTRVLQSLLFSLSTVDPVTYGVTLVLLGLAAFSASWLPAKRASKVDPVVALRAD